MPGKYSHSHVIANYSSRGIISYPNDGHFNAKAASNQAVTDRRSKIIQAQPPQPTSGAGQVNGGAYDSGVLKVTMPQKKEARRIIEPDLHANFDGFDDGSDGDKGFFDDEATLVSSRAKSSHGSRRNSNSTAPSRTQYRRSYSQDLYPPAIKRSNSKISTQVPQTEGSQSTAQHKSAVAAKKAGVCDYSIVGPDGEASNLAKDVGMTESNDNRPMAAGGKANDTSQKALPKAPGPGASTKKSLDLEATRKGPAASQSSGHAEKDFVENGSRPSRRSTISTKKAPVEAEQKSDRPVGILPKNSFGQISAGRDVQKDDDAVSQLSAALPPDIGRFRESQLSLPGRGLFAKLRRGFRRTSNRVV